MDEALARARFLELVRREMSASEVSVIAAAPTIADPKVIASAFGAEEMIVVRFEEPPYDREAKGRRLEMLAIAFQTAREGEAPKKVISARSLREELRVLTARAQAIDALVIDAHSPVVWGAVLGVRAKPGAQVIPLSAKARERVDLVQESHRDLIAALGVNDDDETADDHISQPPPETTSPLSEKAVDSVRALPILGQLHRGAHLAQTERSEEFGWIARSFAAIYVLVLVFDKAFDEIRAERALRDGMPIIERLVLALPPLDPEPAPLAGVISLRWGRRRR
ncbi:hypothetical protein BH09MYX1_BH09MYX1_02460 [soil metagenome]